MRRVAAVLCLILALYCLIAAAATLHAQPVAAEADARTVAASRSVLPLVLPVCLVFVVVLAAAARARTARAARQAAGRVTEAA